MTLVITTEFYEQYPQSILVEFVQDKCDLLDKFEVGKNVKIGINLTKVGNGQTHKEKQSILIRFKVGI